MRIVKERDIARQRAKGKPPKKDGKPVRPIKQAKPKKEVPLSTVLDNIVGLSGRQQELLSTFATQAKDVGPGWNEISVTVTERDQYGFIKHFKLKRTA